MEIERILETITALNMHGKPSTSIQGIAYDSRKVRPGWLFVAVAGHHVDGAEYITEAVSRGAVVVVSEQDLDLGHTVAHIQVSDARQALAEIANVFYGDLSRRMAVVGITGTNGKTTTSYMVRDIFKAAGMNPGLLGTVAYEVGDRSIPASRTTPEAPDIHALFQQMHDAGCDSVVMEVSSHALELKRVHGIDFRVAVFTNLTQDHLDFHKDMETYFSVKAGLFLQLEGERERRAVINIDDPWGHRLLEECDLKAEVITCGFDPSAMVRASRASLNDRGTAFEVHTPWGEARIALQLLGRFNIHNALAALAVGGVCGVPLTTMVAALERIHAVPGRLEAVANRKGRRIFVDYAHTDDALRNVLSTLREICKGRLIVVFGCGGSRDMGKRFKMGRVADELADYSVVTSDNPRNEEPAVIAGDIVKGFSEKQHFEVVLDRREAIERGIRLCGRKDLLLIAGKGHETYQEFQGTIVPFDDRETVKEILG